MNLLPLCTAKVWPTNSGRIVLARLQVFITLFSLRAVMADTLLARCSATYGPFLTLRAMILSMSGYGGRQVPDCVALPRRRPRTIRRCEDFLVLRVFTPSFLPHGLTTLRPPRVRPPCG